MYCFIISIHSSTYLVLNTYMYQMDKGQEKTHSEREEMLLIIPKAARRFSQLVIL